MDLLSLRDQTGLSNEHWTPVIFDVEIPFRAATLKDSMMQLLRSFIAVLIIL